MGLDSRAEEGYFAFAKFLDQHMRDARDRQERIKEARKVTLIHVPRRPVKCPTNRIME